LMSILRPEIAYEGNAAGLGERPISVLICADHPLRSAGLRLALQPHADIKILDLARPFAEAIRDVTAGEVDVAVAEAAPALLDWLAGRTGQRPAPRTARTRADDAVDAAAAGLRPERLVAVVETGSRATMLGAIGAGVRGFVTDQQVDRELPVAVRAVAHGRAFVSPDLAGGLLDWLAGQLPDDPSRFERAMNELSEREREILSLLGDGGSNAEIARRLVISETTVRTHVYHIMSKLKLANRTQAVLFGYQFRLNFG
jgi:DNA-binding NarL/FixJ family response regulator